jgi:hypothetical protein
VKIAWGDEGFALPAVLGAIALMTALAVGGFALAQQSLNDSVRLSFENRAYQAASTGLERELSTFSEAKFQSSYYPTPLRNVNGSDTYFVAVNKLSDGFFEMVSLGQSDQTTESVRVRFQHFDLWDMNIAGAENSQVGSGAGFNGNGTIIGKVYCNGNLEWSGNGSLMSGPVFVRNGVFNKQSSGSNVGVVTAPVDMYLDNPAVGQTTNMYTTYRGNAPRIELPWLTSTDMSTYLAQAKAESVPDPLIDQRPLSLQRAPGASAQYYKWITTNLNIGVDGSSPSFGGDPSVAPVQGTPGSGPDDFAYDNTTGALRVDGIVYVDGLVTIGPNVKMYYGKGTIVACDGIVIDGHLMPAPAFGVPTPDPNYWDGTPWGTNSYPRVGPDYCLGLITPGGVTLKSTGWGFVGAVFSNGPFKATATGASVRGSLICAGIDFSQPNSLLVTQPGLRAYLPSSMPALDGITARGEWLRK